MRRISLCTLLTTLVLLPSLAVAQRTGAAFSVSGVRWIPEPTGSMSIDSQLAMGRTEKSAESVPAPDTSDQQTAPAVLRQFGVHSDLQLPHGSTVSRHASLGLASLSESSKADTSSHDSNRSMHVVIGVVAGVVAGVLLGKAVDKGRAGCGREQSGTTCDWGSGLYEPVFGAIGGLLGGVAGAFLPP